jgi:hypothetical protein
VFVLCGAVAQVVGCGGCCGGGYVLLSGCERELSVW